MINLYYSYRIESKRFLRLVMLFLSPGLITILCHAGIFFPSAYTKDAFSPINSMLSAFGDEVRFVAKITPQTPADGGADPDAADAMLVYATIGDVFPTNGAFALNATVTKENVAPQITGQTPDPLTTEEDQGIAIDFGHLLVSDPDNSYPADFTLTLVPGQDYSVSGLTVTPAANFSGMLQVPVTVNDGEADSEPFMLDITVIPVNDPPVINGQQPDPLTTGQNQPLTILIDNVIVTDPDHNPSELTLNVLAGQNYTASGNTITPASGFSGQLSVNVTVSDPISASESYGLNVAVAANSPPVITGQTPINTNEETPVAVSLSNLTVSDPDNAYPADFTMTLSPGNNYTAEGDVITPNEDFTGTLVVPVTVYDGMNDSAPFDLQIVVQPVNDRPVITGQMPLSTSENQPLTLDFPHLIVEDPDNTYPGDFTMTILSGENYAVDGRQITPVAGFHGDLTVPVLVSDGTESSDQFNVVVTVIPVNDPPRITGQRAIEVNEGTPIILSLQDVTVEDPDNTFPQDFTLVIQPGEHYTVSGTTVTPSDDFSGTLYVNVAVSDGASTSPSFALQINILPVNDAPEITGPESLTTSEDVPITISLNDLVVTDPDNTYPAGFSLSVFAGDNYLLSGNTVTPAQNFYGDLTVPVQVSDGVITSNVFNLRVAVVPVNDVPVITGQSVLETAENTAVTIQPGHLTVLDVDNPYPTGFSLVVAPGANYSVAGTTVLPAVGFNGTLNVPVTVNDGTNTSQPFALQIQVGTTQNAPVITGQLSLSTNEETPVTLALSHLTVYDPDNAYPTGFSMLVSPGVNYTVSGQTVTPAVNYSGILSIPVRVNDGLNNSPTFDFQLSVNQVNDAPSFAPVANVQVVENAPPGSIAITDISKGPMENDQVLTFTAVSSHPAIMENPRVQYDGTGSTALLLYSVKPNMSGLVTVTVSATDNGPGGAPHVNSYSGSFQVEVVEINTAPTLDPLNDITVMEDAEQQYVPLAGITSGPGETQTLTAAVTTDKPDFFEVLDVAYTSPATTGLLQFKTKADVFGTARLTVSVTDNGSGVSPHVNVVTRKFSVIVQPVNDPPYFTSSPLVVAAVNETYEYKVTASDADGENVGISATVKPSWASLVSTGSGQAMLAGKPPQGAAGNVAVTLQARDAVSSVDQKFDIYVNLKPTLTSLAVATAEDSPLTVSSNFFEGGYADANDHRMQAVQITSLPASGKLLLASADVKAGDTIPAASLSGLQYVPNENYFGMDFFGWNAFDGFHFSATPARVDISVIPVNDPPRIIFQNDTLHYEVNGEPAVVSPIADIIDPDDDTLSQVVIGFHPKNYQQQMDALEFQAPSGIQGTFEFQSGLLKLTGKAPLADYRTAIRSVRYLHRNTFDPLLAPKVLFSMAHDGETEGPPTNKVIVLQYTFIEFEIPSGFTPNGDNANDTWTINRPGGGLEEMDQAIISVYNKRGVLVFRTKGFERPWDGTSNGELLPADTYFYTIDLQLRNKKIYKGIVTILR